MGRRPGWLVVVLGGLIAAVSGAAQSPADADALEHNRQLLDKWRADPEHSRRLQHDLRAFYALPLERQVQMRQFDRELHDTDPATQLRLWAVLDRYRDWLERLPDDQRQRVLEARTTSERVQLIQEIRQQQWIDRLPAKVRDDVLKQPAEKRGVLIAELQRQERVQRQVWMKSVPLRSAPTVAPAPKQRPTWLAEYPDPVRKYVKEMHSRLTLAERQKLQEADGKPDLPKIIRELADRHPVLPPLPSGPITEYKQLPVAAKNCVAPDRFGRAQGRWPAYALQVAAVCNRALTKPPSLGASKPGEFPKEVQTFLREKLLPALGKQQKASLHKLEGRWPAYPERLLELARLKHLAIPGMSLPGSREFWEGLGAAP